MCTIPWKHIYSKVLSRNDGALPSRQKSSFTEINPHKSCKRYQVWILFLRALCQDIDSENTLINTSFHEGRLFLACIMWTRSPNLSLQWLPGVIQHQSLRSRYSVYITSTSNNMYYKYKYNVWEVGVCFHLDLSCLLTILPGVSTLLSEVGVGGVKTWHISPHYIVGLWGGIFVKTQFIILETD